MAHQHHYSLVLLFVGSSYNGVAAETWSVNATVPADPNTVVARDGSGNVTANVFIGALQGNADSATAAASLSANPTINGVVFDGTGPITVSTSPGNQLPLTAGAYLTGANYTGGAAVTFDVEADTNNTPNTLAARDGSGVIRATTFAGALAGAASSAATANNAQTADALTTPRQINGTPFDGTADIKIGVPVINRGAATLSATDNGSMIAATGTQSIPVLSAGITISIWNNTSGDIALNNSGTVVYNAGTGNVGSVTLGSRGIATVQYMSSTTAVISGTRLS